MALISRIVNDRSTAYSIAQALLTHGVISTPDQAYEAQKLLSPLDERRKGAVALLVNSMTIAKGSPDSVSATVAAAEKLGLYGVFVDDLKGLRSADASVSAPKIEAVIKKDRSGLHSAVGISGVIFGLLSFLGDDAVTVLSQSYNAFRRRPLTADQVDAAKQGITSRVESSSARSSGFPWGAMLAVLSLGVLLFFVLMFAWVGVWWTLAFLVAGFLLAIWVFKQFATSFSRRGKVKDMRMVWNELPPVLQSTGVKVSDLWSKSNPAAWNKVDVQLDKSLDRAGFWNNAFEQSIDNLLDDAINLLKSEYRTSNQADRAFLGGPVAFPEQAYRHMKWPTPTSGAGYYVRQFVQPGRLRSFATQVRNALT